MHITRYTDYALRVLIYLAVHDEGLSTISEIAKSYDISKNHLMKIVQELSSTGYINAIRGKNGGLRLNRPASDINIGALIRETESESKIVECFGENNTCIITPTCQLKKVFSEALESFYATLEAYTLADLAGKRHRKDLINLLAINVA